jgi:NAD binding domain of 6-phosphogluconate dehydrogenase
LLSHRTVSAYPINTFCYQPARWHDQLTDLSARLAGINVGAPARPVPSGDFGLIGLAVMGQNLILNAADHGFTVVAYNRTVSKVDRFLENEAKGALTILLAIDSLATILLTIIPFRQIGRRCSLHPGVCFETEETPPHYAPRHGWQACR